EPAVEHAADRRRRKLVPVRRGPDLLPVQHADESADPGSGRISGGARRGLLPRADARLQRCELLMLRGLRRRPRGQAPVGFALILPIALIVIFGIIVFGIFVFYQQQITNVAREAARYAAIHSSTSLCPTSGWRDPQAPPTTYTKFPFSCDGV